jgi:phytoene dehydrogenase-like protein
MHMTEPREANQAIVVGGGLGGLAAAAFLARAGRQVTLFERAPEIGGRAATHRENGFLLNLGPHALYRGGAGMRILGELGITPQGGVPSPDGGHAVDRGIAHTLPAGPISLLTTGLLRLPAKLELGRLLGAAQRIDTAPLARTSVDAWLASALRHDGVRRLLAALFRLSTYANAPETQSAGAALAQLQLALAKNVLYLHHGWQTLVDGLRAAATTAGARIVSAARVAAVEDGADGAVAGIRLASGETIAADAVVLAVAPREAASLVGERARGTLEAWSDALVPVRAACLEVGLKSLPRPRSRFALGIDRPLYLSVHSAVAELAPPGTALIHVAKYLPTGTDGDQRADERELEGLLDLIQPGWREVLVTRRWLPRMIVSNALVTAAAGGLAGRPGPAVPGVRGLCVVGDWVGGEGQLADATLASARRAAVLLAGTDGRTAVAA